MLTKEQIRAAGGWVRDDGSIVFKDISLLNALLVSLGLRTSEAKEDV
jgi:hypothetical protein